MASFHSRYQQGEREQVWIELRYLQKDVREEQYFVDALAVAVETMQRVRRNVEMLIDRLTESGYQFQEGIKFPLSPPEKHPGLLSFVVQDFWTLGLSARAWIEVVGEVNLSGTHPKWQNDNLTGNTLIVEFEKREEFIDKNVQTYESTAELIVEYESVEGELTENVINIESPDKMPQHIHRISVGDDGWYQCLDGVGWIIHRHEILIPDRSADATIDLEIKQMFFVDYLREIFKWGGFPNFERFGLHPHDEPVLSLAKDLLPI